MVDKILAFAAIFGAICLVSGVYMINDTTVLLGRSQETTATVVDYILHEVYYPIFEFKDTAGLTVTAQSIDSSPSMEYNIRRKVPILYNSINPSENVRINTLSNIWLGPILLTVMGAFNVVLSVGLYWKKLKTNDLAPPASSL